MTTEPALGAEPERMLRAEAERHLRALVGTDDARLREDQWAAIEALVARRRRALVVQRTGWGKSAVYFVATALLRARGAGPTVIISPLLALMRNQITAAQRAGITAVTVNSANLEQWAQVYDEIGAGSVDVLLVSPERLNNPDFRDRVLPELAASAGLLVIDEAHCISDWGHDFRPDYRRIRTMLADLPAGIPVLATTATANARVTRDVAEQLAVAAGANAAETVDAALESVLVLRGDLDRTSLHLAVLALATPAARLAWLATHLAKLPGSGIIYCLTVAATADVTAYLRERGYAVAAYTGQTEQTERLATEDALLGNRVKAVVATSALGMGFDKPDLGWVVNLGAPPSPIAYYQQVGRAGRATSDATVVLLPGREDQEVWNYFASLSFPPQQQVRQTIAALEGGGVMSTAMLETQVELRHTRLEQMLKVLDVDGAVRRVKGGWESTGRPWTYDEQRYEQVQHARKQEQEAMLAYIDTTQCRMQFLRQALDDPDAAPCGRCDNCGGIELAAESDADAVAQAQSRMDRPGVTVEPRRLWPVGLGEIGVNLRGKIAVDELPEPGRAIARLTDLGWGSALRELFAAGAPDGQLPVSLRRALADVVDEWFGREGKQAADAVISARPDVVVGVGSLSHPVLCAHLADGMARYLNVPLPTQFEVAGAAGTGQGYVNSAQRVRALHDRYRLPNPAAVAGRRVLLVDDRTDTGWTLTLLARELRRAGAVAVYPLVLAAST